MKKIAVLLFSLIFLAACGAEAPQSLDVKDLNKVDESVLKKNQKKQNLDDRPMKQVLTNGMDNLLKNKKYEMQSVVSYEVLEGEGKATKIYQLEDLKMMMKEKVDFANEKMELSINIQLDKPGSDAELGQEYYVEKSKVYLGKGNLLPPDLVKYANQHPILIDIEGAMGGSEQFKVNQVELFGNFQNIVNNTDEKNMVRKGLNESEIQKGYKNAIAIKVDANEVDLGQQELQSYEDLYHVEGINTYYLVIWLDEKDKIKKVLTQTTIEATDSQGAAYNIKLDIEQTYEEKETLLFTINPQDKHYKLSNLIK